MDGDFLLARLEKRKMVETDKQRIDRNVKEIFDNIVVIFQTTRFIPFHKFLIQFIASLVVTIVFTATNLDESLLLKISIKDSVFYKVLLASFYTLPQALIFYFLFRKNIRIFFRKITKKHFTLSLTIAFASIVVAMFIAGLLVYGFSQTMTAHSEITTFSPSDIFTYIIQLLGEEILFFSAFFLSLKLFTKRKEPQYVLSVWISGLIACLVFGLAHLWTYDFNVIQCVIVIGLPSIIKIVLYLKTRNLWSTYLAHLFYDLMAIVITFSGKL
ncbi:CPBP family intramembrane glutamic endopeptidase [Priestia megaterium]|uniref:CPBP family intramembrane glutamic endopeptidase n=1 Tax=Priestia megaterium TaxID=1404 RepID=UPI0039DFFD31